jgi:hypothetical protein
MYGRSLKWVNRQLKKQKHRCAICRKKYNKKGEKLVLALDHLHKLEKLKIKCKKLKSGLWKAYNIEFDWETFHLSEAKITFKSSNKKKAVKQVRLVLKRLANRGFVCWPCNGGLRHWNDNYRNMTRAGKYLKAHADKLAKGQ